jgi:hypothetical protein
MTTPLPLNCHEQAMFDRVRAFLISLQTEPESPEAAELEQAAA